MMRPFMRRLVGRSRLKLQDCFAVHCHQRGDVAAFAFAFPLVAAAGSISGLELAVIRGPEACHFNF